MGFSQGFCLSYSCLMEFLGRGRCFLQAGGYSSRRAPKAQAEPIQAKQGWESACEGDRAGKARRCKEKPNTPCQCTLVAHNPTVGGKIIATPYLQVALTPKVTDKEQAPHPPSSMLAILSSRLSSALVNIELGGVGEGCERRHHAMVLQ